MTAAAGTAPEAGQLARLTAALLADGGLTVTGPDAADAELHWCPFAAEAAGPHRMADLAAALLSGQAGARHPDTVASGDIAFKGIVGMDFRAGGFKVDLNVYSDDYCYDVTGEITVTDPRAGHGAAVHVTDGGGLTWYRGSWDEYAAAEREPLWRTGLPAPPAVARAMTPAPGETSR